MTAAPVLATIDAHWSATFGQPIDGLDPHRPAIIAHAAALAGYNGLYAFRHTGTGACVISVPAPQLGRARAALENRGAADVFTVGALTAAFEGLVDRVIGLASIAYADASDFRAQDPSGVRLLDPVDDAALRALAAAAGETDWEHSGIELGRTPIFGRFDGDTLIAACSYEPLGEHILHLGIVTHPACRGRGHGAAVAAATTRHGLAAGRIMQWQTLAANHPSLAIARTLGYREYCRTIAIRLK